MKAYDSHQLCLRPLRFYALIVIDFVYRFPALDYAKDRDRGFHGAGH